MTFLTKGYIPENTITLMLNNANKIRAQIGIITTDECVRRIFEPNATSIEMRLQQMERMAVGGIAVEARLMPILPGITDTDESLDRIFRKVADTKVKQAAISTLFLRPAIVEALKRYVPDKRLVSVLLDMYKGSGRLPVRAAHSSVVPLPRPEREKIYARVGKAATRYNINISVCGCMNPDIGGTCNIGGSWSDSCDKSFQLALFEK